MSARALQIAMGAPVILATAGFDLVDPVGIAQREFDEGVVPITVHRPEGGKVPERKHPGITTRPRSGR